MSTFFLKPSLTKLLDLTDSSNARKTITNKKTTKKRKDADRKDVSCERSNKISCLMFSLLQVGQFLCCVSRKKRTEKQDRVETAFRRLDINGDGFIDWSEFQKVEASYWCFKYFSCLLDVCQGTSLDAEQADRIFSSCDKVGED